MEGGKRVLRKQVQKISGGDDTNDSCMLNKGKMQR
jgi:hypothetical protein